MPFQKGELHHNWKGGVTNKKRYCEDCGIELGKISSNKSISRRCLSCSKKGDKNPIHKYKMSYEERLEKSKRFSGENNPCYGKFGKDNPRYKHNKIRNNFCIDCKTEISLGAAIRCHHCNSILRWKNSSLKDRLSERSKKMWADKDFRIKTLESQRAGRKTTEPNKLELKFIKILESLDLYYYKYVGNWKVCIGGFCPDFIDEDDKRIIELYGKYWHNKRPEIDERRLITYENAGYKTLVIWDYEFEDLNTLEIKVLDFVIGDI